MKGKITPEAACNAVGGLFNKKKNKCSVTLDDAQTTCKFLGGDYDYDDETCDLPINDPTQPMSVTSKPTFIAFFVLQVVIGAATTILAVWYSPTDLPPTWWTSYVMLGLSYLGTVFMYYYKFIDWKEAFFRSTISLIAVGISSVITGWIYYWDITLYWGLAGFAGLPIAATIPGIIIASLLSIVLVELETRKADNPSNEFGGGGTISVIG